MVPGWPKLLQTARAVVDATRRSLPGDLRDAAAAVPVVYEPRPNDALLDDGVEPDLLGLFVGDPHGQPLTESHALPPQILLFLENLWDFADDDPDFYRDEVRTTYLHELGHYLGLDEDDLDKRGLL